MDFKEQLRAQVDIVRVASDYVRLRRVGNRYSGLCPFHNEKTPSFSISAEHQFFRCFGCDAKGDVFSFVMMIEGLTFWEALKKLADQHGIALPKQSLASDEETRLRASLYEMHEIAFEHFRRNLAGPNGDSVRAYIAKRGVTETSVQKFGLGLAEGSGRALLRVLEQRGFRPEQLEVSGLVGKRDDGSFYDRFRNRLIFPIQNESGKTIAFGGRALDPEDKAKYLNSPETKIYRKSNVLFNLNRAKETAMKIDGIFLVEGYLDVIGPSQLGLAEVVASCGTALTTEQIGAMRRFSRNVYVTFDGDAAGKSSVRRSISLLLNLDMRVKVVDIPDGSDPDEYCRKHGLEAFRKLIANSKHFVFWLLDENRNKFNMREPQGRVDALRSVWPEVLKIPDPLERVSLVHDLASYVGVDRGMILDDFRRAAVDRVERAPAPRAESSRATDRILLPLLVNESEARAELIDKLRGLPALRQLSTAPIFDALFTMHDAGEPINFNTLHARIHPSLQDMLAAIVLDAGSGGGATLEDGMACVEALRREDRETILRELKIRIKSAEREGRLSEALALMQQLSQFA